MDVSFFLCSELSIVQEIRGFVYHLRYRDFFRDEFRNYIQSKYQNW